MHRLREILNNDNANVLVLVPFLPSRFDMPDFLWLDEFNDCIYHKSSFKLVAPNGSLAWFAQAAPDFDVLNLSGLACTNILVSYTLAPWLGQNWGYLRTRLRSPNYDAAFTLELIGD